MINDHRPYWFKNLMRKFERGWAEQFVAPAFESLGFDHHLMKPWHIRIHGKAIRAGNNLHIVSDLDRKVSFSTWTLNEHQGQITLGNNVLICPGCRFDSASAITVGDNCMFAAGSYVTDADWHDIYDRTQAVGTTKPVILGNNVWVGDGVTVCKGVSIGENSVIGAGSVVVSDIPPNVIAAGNPATVIKPLDPERELITRERLFENPEGLAREMEKIDRYVLHNNTFLDWLRSRVMPKRGD